MILINSSPQDVLKLFQPFLPIFVPVGIGYLLAVCEREKIKVSFVDQQVEKNVIDLIKNQVVDMERPYIFGFSVITASFQSAVLLSKRLKDLYPDCVICFGGIHPTAVAYEVLSFDHIDYVLRGEGESNLPELYRCIKSGKKTTHISSLSFRINGKTVHNERAPIIADLNTLPIFFYHHFDPQKYDLGFIVSSRGCPYKCIFCSNRIATGRQYRYINADRIIDTIDLLYNKYGKRHIYFFDDNFLFSKSRIRVLLSEIRKRELEKKVKFSFQGTLVDKISSF